jgi:hypothetical protein
MLVPNTRANRARELARKHAKARSVEEFDLIHEVTSSIISIHPCHHLMINNKYCSPQQIEVLLYPQSYD